MAAAPVENDFRAVLDGVWEDLLDYMDLVTALEELKKSEAFRPSTLRDLQEKHPTTSERISALLQLVKDGGYTKYVQFKQCLGSSGQERLVEKLEAAERGEYQLVLRKKPRTDEEHLLEVLKEDLIAYYIERESTMSVAPLVEQHEAELTKFYVRPPMIAYNTPYAFGQKKQENSKEKMSNEKTNIRSYRELLLKDTDPYRGIYVTADAGMGKTSFAKMLAITWCEAHTRNAAENYLVEETSDSVFNNETRSNTATETSVSVAGSSVFPLISVSETEDDAFSDTDSDSFISIDTDIDSYTSTDTDTDSYTPDRDSFTFTDDFYTLEIFEYLFLIKLRECSDKCQLDDMILEMMKSKLKHKTSYTEEFLEKILCNKRCLIIMDGLDEWIHPQTCRRGEVIPHRRAWPKCTVLTTTRPWKLSTAQLSKVDIDRQVEISRLDKTAARELESRAIELLNENQRQNDQVAANTKTKTATGFKNSVPKTILGHVRYSPFVLLQMICLWFENSPIGKSLCEVYSNIIELTLTRWLVKTDSGHTDCECKPSKVHENNKLKCFENNKHCQCYMPLLLKIGQLAFSTLFNVVREESLLFHKKQVLKYLSREELKLCLDMGLLSQVKDTTSLTEVRQQLYFPHKTLHEFFYALFIATNWNNAKTRTMSIKQTISNKCRSVSDILEMSEMFVFFCGLNPEVYSKISRHLATIVSTDQGVIDYRNGVEEGSCLLQDYQRMQISCFLESTRNQHPECKIVIEDMFVGDYSSVDLMKEDEIEEDEIEEDEIEEIEIQALERILPVSACSMKSLYLYLPSLGEIVRILEHAEFPCLEYLSVNECELAWFQNVLTSAAHTLKYLELAQVSLTDDLCSAILRLKNLQYLHLVSVSVDSLNAVSDCISGCMSLQKLTLNLQYTPTDTDEKPEQHEASTNYLLRSIEAKTMLTYLTLRGDVVLQNGVLDLSKHVKLQKLDLFLPLTELHINTEQLVTCIVTTIDGFFAPIVSSLLAELHGAPVLETLILGHIRNPTPRIEITALPRLTDFALWKCDLRESTVTLTLPRLTKFTLTDCDLRDSTVTVSPEMTSLETITLCNTSTTVNIPCWRELFLSIRKLSQPITVKLEKIKMTLGEWRELLFGILGKCPKSIHVEMLECKGPSEEEWKNIFDELKASSAFRITRSDCKVGLYPWERCADIYF